MPSQPAWFHRLDEILALLRGFDTRYLDRKAGREAVERYAREVAEAALAHVVRDKVEAAYARSDLFERRRQLMNEWAAYLNGAGVKALCVGGRTRHAADCC